MNIETGYNKWAGSYDSMLNKTRDLDLIATKENLNGKKFQSVLEIGCGTGKNTEWLSEMCLIHVAVDFSEEMMAIGKSKVPAKHIEWRRCDVSKPWSIPNGNFDLITFNLVLEHISDLNFVFAEAASRLAIGGIIHLSELHPFKQYLGSKARFESELGTHELEVFVHHVSDFVNALSKAGLQITSLGEWFDEDCDTVPRLLTMIATNSLGLPAV